MPDITLVQSTDKTQVFVPSGLIIIDKPVDWTSHDVVGWLRRLLKIKRIGHAGTLDPFATGVLVLGCGHATRVLEYASGERKTYEAVIHFGVTTDTEDRTGTVTSTFAEELPAREKVEAALAALLGESMQIPPQYSALKKDGVPMYKHARNGVTVEIPARPITVYRAELLDYSAPFATVLFEVSAGTYIRSLARDLGESLGVGGSLQELRRIKSGSFDIAEALSLAEVESRWNSVEKVTLFQPEERALVSLPRYEITLPAARKMALGQGIDELDFSEYAKDQDVTIWYEQKCVGLVCWREDQQMWKVKKVFTNPAELQ